MGLTPILFLVLLTSLFNHNVFADSDSFTTQGSATTVPKRYFLTVILQVLNEVDSILEFLQHYVEEGVDHFYIYDDGSTDGTIQAVEDCLPPEYYSLYSKEDFNLTHKYDIYMGHNNSLQLDVSDQIYREYGARRDSEWVMIVDADEYVTSRSSPGKTIKDVLRESFQHCGALQVPWILYSWGDQTESPKNFARYTLNWRWGFNDEHAMDDAKKGKFENINRGVRNKFIMNTASVHQMRGIHEIDFSTPEDETRLRTRGVLCIPRDKGFMRCAQDFRAANWQPPSMDDCTVVFNGVHGRFSASSDDNSTQKVFQLPPYCPYCTRIIAPLSTDRTQVREDDVSHLMLAVFHYRVKSADDFQRLTDPTRHSAPHYLKFADRLELANRLDVLDPFMMEKRLPARKMQFDFLKALRMFSSCPAKYYNYGGKLKSMAKNLDAAAKEIFRQNQNQRQQRQQ